MSTDDSSPDVEPESRTCFVIGPIGNRHAEIGTLERETYEEALQAYEEVIAPACKEVRLEPIRADGLTRPGELTEQIFRRLRDDDVVIADLTGANANVMYELGLRHTRNKLTAQVGEFGRLPFDVSVIRTVMFSRSAHGLIQARKELTELLRTGLAGEFDPVTATRIWSGLGVEAAILALERPAAPEDDGPGFLDVLAEGEEQLGNLSEIGDSIARHIAAMGDRATMSTDEMQRSDASGKGMKGRLAIAVRYATDLADIATDLEADVDRYVDAMSSISAANHVIIDRLEDDPAQVEDALDWALITRRLAQTARDSTAELSGLVVAIGTSAQASRALRGPSGRITAALERFAAATSVADEWDRRLQALGVPVPDEDWEPPEVDTGGDAPELAPGPARAA